MIEKETIKKLLGKAHLVIMIIVIIGLFFRFKEYTWTIIDVAIVVVCGYTAFLLLKK